MTSVGAFFPIEVHVPPAIAALLNDQNLPVPAPLSGLALIDTGATLTCVHETLLARLGLNPIGVITSGTASGPVQQNVYPARIVFPAQGWTIDLAGVAGVNLAGQQVATTPPQPIIALIGRNILQNWLMVWNGPAAFWSVAV